MIKWIKRFIAKYFFKKKIKEMFDVFNHTIDSMKDCTQNVMNYKPENDPIYVRRREELRKETENNINAIKEKYQREIMEIK
jgi:hypothetical protein